MTWINREGRTFAPSSLAYSAAGITALVVGCVVLADTPIGLEWTNLPSVLIEQLPITLPAIALVVMATATNLAAGLVVIRALAGQPFRSRAEAVLGGLTGAVLLDLVLMMGLGAIDLFRAPVVLGALALVVLAAWPRRANMRPIVRASRGGEPWRAPWLLIAVVWAIPITLMLTAPIVAWNDVPANHVAPPEHLRTYGSLDPLDTSPSPRYAPSRNFLGYIAFHGTLSTISDLPAARSVVAFVPALAVLVAIAFSRLGASLFGRGAGQWTLVTLPLTFVFLRIPDSRATVMAFPIAVFTLLALMRAPRELARRAYVVVAAGLGATIFVHPLMGALVALTVAILILAKPERFAANGIPAVACGLVLAMAQLGVMLGVSLPSAGGLLPVLWAAALGLALEGLLRHGSAPLLRIGLIGAAAVALLLSAERAAEGLFGAVNSLGSLFPVLAISAGLGAPLLRRRRAGLLMSGAALGGWLAGSVMLSTAPIPASLVESLRFEVPKSFSYWTPVFLAVVAAGGLSEVQRRLQWPAPARHLILLVFILVAALPLRAEITSLSGATEHRLSETATINARFATRGWWVGYPDPRYLIDEAGQELVSVLREEQRSGRLTSDTQVLHLADEPAESSQIPIAVFAGVVEWLVTEEPDRSIHVDATRQPHIRELAGLVGPDFPYLVLEPANLDTDPQPIIDAAGYEVVFTNDRGTIFRLPSVNR